MDATVDSVGRIVIPKALRDELGLKAGTRVDVSRYGTGLTVIAGARTATVSREGGRLVATGDTPVDDDVVFALIDAGRR